MKKWEKPSPELVARFEACLPKAPGVQRRLMFGCPCAFVNGRMFTGLHEQRLIVRLGDSDRATLAREPGAIPFVVMGKAMREYIAFEHPLDRTPREIGAWMKRALAYAASLPPKVPAARSGSGITRKVAVVARKSSRRNRPAVE